MVILEAAVCAAIEMNYITDTRLRQYFPSHLHTTARCLVLAAGGAVGPAAAERQVSCVVDFKLRSHKVCVVGEPAALQLRERDEKTPSTHSRKTT